MKTNIENSEKTRVRILSLIDSTFENDAEFEREMEIPPKTVSNWRRGRSSSYMRLLPALADKLGVSIGALLDAPIMRDSSELSDDELRILQCYRRAGALSPTRRVALCETLERIIELYVGDSDGMEQRRGAATARSGKRKES